MNTPARTVIYLRQSLDREGNALAITRQRTECRNLCSRRRWKIADEYADNDTSATNGHRPQYEAMLDAVRDGNVSRIVAYHADRLYRQPRDLEDLIDLCNAHAVEIATVSGDLNLSVDMGRLVARILGAVSKGEIERKTARQKVANKQRAQDGKAWKARTFGYDGDTIVPEETEAIVAACAALLNGVSLYAIAQKWNAAGLRSVNGRTWTGGTVRQVLMRPRNAGLAVYGGEVLEGVETSWSGIVSRDTWQAVCDHLADPKRLTGKSKSRVHLLSGLALCGACEKTVNSSARRDKPGGPPRPKYQCKRPGCMRIVRDLARVDELVVDIVTRRLARPDAAKIFARPTVDTRALNKEANELRALIAAAEREYDQGVIDGRRLQGRIDTLQPKLDVITEKLVGATTSRKLDGLLGNPDAPKVFTELSLDRRRAVIDTVCVVTIEQNERPGAFDPERIRIDWRS
jgi:site-specific DNA recombinase